jgi:hypothetical protein
MHVEVDATSIPADQLVVSSMQRIVDRGLLTSFASTDAEKFLFISNNITTLFSPRYLPGNGGYSSGNTLIGTSPDKK